MVYVSMRGSMKLGLILSVLMVVGCATNIDNEEDSPEIVSTPSRLPEGRSEGRPNPCAGAYSEAVVNGVRVKIPVQCRQGWIDMGDPPPDEPMSNPFQRVIQPASQR